MLIFNFLPIRFERKRPEVRESQTDETPRSECWPKEKQALGTGRVKKKEGALCRNQNEAGKYRI